MQRGKIFRGLSKNIMPHHKIFHDVAKYFAISFNNIHVADKYTNMFHDMAWNML
jgi:hypothetical protein